MPAGDGGLGLREHVGGGGLDEAEDAVEVGGEGGSPLLAWHGLDGLVVWGPDAVVDDEDVEAAEDLDCGLDEGAAVFGGGEDLLDGLAEAGAALLGGEGVGLGGRALVAEDDLCAGLAEEPDGGGADAPGAAGDEGDATAKR